MARQPGAGLAAQGPFGVVVHEVGEDADLPFAGASFDLVMSRHPAVTVWSEVARVLHPGGTFLSQQVGAGSNRELYELLMGPQPASDRRSPGRAVAAAQASGLDVVDLRSESLRVVFGDIGAVVHFLCKVPWTVPGFTVDAYRASLLALHRRIECDGPFVTHSERFLIEARKPA